MEQPGERRKNAGDEPQAVRNRQPQGTRTAPTKTLENAKRRNQQAQRRHFRRKRGGQSERDAACHRIAERRSPQSNRGPNRHRRAENHERIGAKAIGLERRQRRQAQQEHCQRAQEVARPEYLPENAKADPINPEKGEQTQNPQHNHRFDAFRHCSDDRPTGDPQQGHVNLVNVAVGHNALARTPRHVGVFHFVGIDVAPADVSQRADAERRIEQNEQNEQASRLVAAARGIATRRAGEVHGLRPSKTGMKRVGRLYSLMAAQSRFHGQELKRGG